MSGIFSEEHAPVTRAPFLPPGFLTAVVVIVVAATIAWAVWG